MKITKDVTSNIVFRASQELLFWLGQEMAKCEGQKTEAEKIRWRALFDCLDHIEKWRYEKEFEVSDVTKTEIKEL